VWFLHMDGKGSTIGSFNLEICRFLEIDDRTEADALRPRQ
jgi:hypothetical protein